MPRVGGSGISGIGAPRVLYADVEQLEALKADLDKTTVGRAAPPAPPGSVAALAWEKGGRPDMLLSPPPLPPGWTRRPGPAELHLFARRIVHRRGGAAVQGAEARLLSALESLVAVRDRLQARVAEGMRA